MFSARGKIQNIFNIGQFFHAFLLIDFTHKMRERKAFDIEHYQVASAVYIQRLRKTKMC